MSTKQTNEKEKKLKLEISPTFFLIIFDLIRFFVSKTHTLFLITWYLLHFIYSFIHFDLIFQLFWFTLWSNWSKILSVSHTHTQVVIKFFFISINCNLFHTFHYSKMYSCFILCVCVWSIHLEQKCCRSTKHSWLVYSHSCSLLKQKKMFLVIIMIIIIFIEQQQQHSIYI